MITAHIAPPAAADERSEKIDELRKKVDDASAKQQSELDQIAASDARLNEADQLIRRLEEEVNAARQRVGVAERELGEATSKVSDAQARLAEVEADLRGVQDKLNKRAVSLYKQGAVSGATILLEADSLRDAELNIAYEKRLQERDQKDADTLVAKSKDASDRRHTLEIARATVEARRDAYAQEKRDLERSLADQKKLADTLQKEVDNHKKLLATIEGDLSKNEAALNELEGQSRAIGGMRLSRGSGSGKLVWPADGGVVSPFGMRFHPILHYSRLHAGVDIGAGYGSPVIAAASGVVISAGGAGGYGNMIVIDHGDGLATAYAHLSHIGVSAGQSVTQRQEIGNVGCTGLCSGPHLHFETRVNGQPVDPMGYFR